VTSSAHLSDRQVADYRAGGLAPEALLAIDDHLASCTRCRQRLFSPRAASSALPPFGSRHLEYEEIEALLEERLADPEKQRIADHLALCRSCAAEADDLRQLRRELVAVMKPAPQRSFRRIAFLGAIAAVVVCVWGVRISQRDAVVRELAGLSPEYRHEVEQALHDGRIEVPLEMLNSLRGNRGQLRGQNAHDRVELVEPVAVVVRSQKPMLRWKAVPGASGYQASIYDQELHPVARSPKLTVTEWAPGAALDRGHRYFWEVTAQTPGGEIRSASPSDPTPEFAVLDAQQASELERAERQYPNAHLLLAIEYAKAGLVEEAQRELSLFEADNPKSSVPRRLLKNLSDSRK
jgi:hypothetical protein